MKFDNVSFSKEGFEKFKTLTKEKQIEKLANMLNPKDEERAKVLLKNVPYDSKSDDRETSDDNASGVGKQYADSDNVRPETKGRKNKRVS